MRRARRRQHRKDEHERDDDADCDTLTTDTINGTTTDGATPAPQSVHDFIDQTVHQNPVVLFMKGTAQFPQCGFSGRAIQLLKANGVTSLVTVNVLEDDEVRQGVKAYSNWPTVPQLYIGGEFVGGRTSSARCTTAAN